MRPSPQRAVITNKTFNMTDSVSQRMRAVVGATNYSLALRNSEHVGRYIQSGSWTSHQMEEGGKLWQRFQEHMTMTGSGLINTLPEELRPKCSQYQTVLCTILSNPR